MGIKRTWEARTRALVMVGAFLLLAVLTGAPAAPAATPAADCQPFAEPCLLPFPNDLFTRPDSTSATGLRVDLPQAAMPTNTNGAQIGVAPYDRNDGFSPGSSIIARIPGLDNEAAFDRTAPVRLDDMSDAYAPNAPIVVIDAATGQRALIWTELDSNAGDPEHTTLLIHPGKSLTEGHRYVVGLRNLKDAQGHAIAAPSWFANFRDERPLPKSLKDQRQRYRSIFKTLKKARIKRKTLDLAWDFTVASRQSLTSPMLAIRNDAFGQLGDTNLSDLQVQGSVPPFAVTNVQNFTPEQNPKLLREVVGTFTVPCYLTTCELRGRRRLQLQLGEPRRDAHPAVGQRRDRAVRLHHPAGGVHGRGARFPVWPRIARFADRGPRRERPGHGGGARLRLLRHRLVGARLG